MTATTGSGSPPSPSSPPTRRSRSRFQPSLSSSSSPRRRQRSWSPQSPSSSSQSGGRRSRSRSCSPRLFPLATLPSSSEAAAEVVEGDAKALYMFFWYPKGPIIYGLYAVNIPDPYLPVPPLQRCDQFTELEKAIYPILEFPSGEYPSAMCCVEFESKLYFLGGYFAKKIDFDDWDPMAVCPPDLHVLDTKAISTTTTTVASELLRKGTQMSAGKPRPYAFVVHRKIYATSGFASGFASGFTQFKKPSRFEVFDIESDKWSTLPDPPLKFQFCGQAIVGGKIFLVAENHDVFYFDVDTCVWVSFSKRRVPIQVFCGSAQFVEDTLYALQRNLLVAFGPISESHPEPMAKGLFEHSAYLCSSSDVSDAIKDILLAYRLSSFLVHLGNKTFCYILTRDFEDPKYPEIPHLRDPEKRVIDIITFEVLQDADTESPSGGEKTLFLAKLLRTAQFFARTKRGAIVGDGLMLCCFSISTSA